ncbi:hypothetical protein FB45DRAFT_792663 [Roridomyces roridus]|uniref:Cyclin N-terminal domain-containing protein n=1 Tax=Roridomyces roridus TaxID=1738132 RepID=A0AAD7BY04_9AGAR|nr:hypothetical protein FB45DRAFT_792663 [Roridomyces roridus]
MRYSQASSSSAYASWSPSSSSSSGSPVHAASLVDASSHSPDLLHLIDVKLSKPVIQYVVDCVSETVDCAMGRPTRARQLTPSPYLPKFISFAQTVLARAEVRTPTLLVALVYISRARPHLSIALEQYALERVFLGALMCASKYTNDSTLKNVHWALCTGLFGRRDVGRIEREFLDVLDWELGVREADVMAHHEGILRASQSVVYKTKSKVSPPPRKSSSTPYTRRVPAPVPELAPSRASSPSSSSDDSMSPPTPEPMEVDPVPAPVPAKSSKAKGGLQDLLSAFPTLPIPISIPVAHYKQAYRIPVVAA